MIGASKILTVSYGTFSCTLEGFDDPFNTMRAIAEYFRDLAAEDRYFGAEPPTPDAAMLHKIAEREIQRRVEAKIDGNGVILRAGEAQIAPMPQLLAERSAPAYSEPMRAAAGPVADDSVADLPDEPDTDGVADVAATVEDVQTEEIYAEEVYSEDEHADILQTETPSPSAPLASAESADETIASVIAGLHDVVPHAEDLALADGDETTAEVWQAAAEPVEPTDAPTLSDPDAAAVSDPFELPADMFAVAAYDMTAEPEPDTLAGLEPEMDSRPDAATQDAPEWPLVWDMAFSDVDLDGPMTFEPPAPATAVAEQPETPTDDQTLAATLGALIDPEGDDDFEADQTDDVAALPDADAEAMAPEAGENQSAEAAFAATMDPAAPVEQALTDVDAGAQDRLQRARARVIKIRRIDVAAVPTTTTPAPPPTPEPTVPAAPMSDLSPEAEAELQRELAAFEAELAPDMPVAETTPAPSLPPETDATLRTDTPETTRLPEATDSDDAVNRLISQTNSVMEGPENKRRLAAIAHLKAAVAATFADRKANPGASQPGPAERMDPYRDDLDRVVRPRRPALVGPSGQSAAAAATARPQIDTRPAPLVLVSAQRIDRPAAISPVAASAVRPRRVTTSMLPADAMATPDATDEYDDDGLLTADDVNNIFADPSQPFVEFAERLGAASMSEMIEAAAAYCALFLGREQFTRPLLMQQIADLPDGSAITREDCLRGFGTLLRDGRIEKIKRGQFKLADHSRYLAEARRMAG